jgi:hypothetical protein
VHSVHAVTDPRLRAGVEEYLQREAAQLSFEMAQLQEHGPFRRGPENAANDGVEGAAGNERGQGKTDDGPDR